MKIIKTKDLSRYIGAGAKTVLPLPRVKAPAPTQPATENRVLAESVAKLAEVTEKLAAQFTGDTKPPKSSPVIPNPSATHMFAPIPIEKDHPNTWVFTVERGEGRRIEFIHALPMNKKGQSAHPWIIGLERNKEMAIARLIAMQDEKVWHVDITRDKDGCIEKMTAEPSLETKTTT